MDNVLGKQPGGKWGQSLYEFTRLYLEQKEDRVKIGDEELDRFIDEELEYPERVDTTDEFFDYALEVREAVDEVLEDD